MMNPFVAVCEQNRNDFLRETKFETKNQFHIDLYESSEIWIHET